MEDWKTKLVTEQKELLDKINNLECFIHSDTYQDLDNQIQCLLGTQLFYMKEYFVALTDRMKLLQIPETLSY